MRFIYIIKGEKSPGTFASRDEAMEAGLNHAGTVIAGITTASVRGAA